MAERDWVVPSDACDSTDTVRFESGCPLCVVVESVEVFLGAASVVGRYGSQSRGHTVSTMPLALGLMRMMSRLVTRLNRS